MRALLPLLAFAAPTARAAVVHGRFDAPNNDYYLDWTVDREGGEMNMTMAAKTEGWVALSWGGGCHWRADCATGWVDSSGDVVLHDMWTNEEEEPPIDAQQDLEVLTGSFVDGWTSITFRRALRTGDSADNPIVDENLALGWAYGREDGDGDGEIEEHEDGEYGVLRANIWAGKAWKTKFPSTAGEVMLLVSLLALLLLGARHQYAVRCAGARVGEGAAFELKAVSDPGPGPEQQAGAPKPSLTLHGLLSRRVLPKKAYTVGFAGYALAFALLQACLVFALNGKSSTLGLSLGSLTAANALLTTLPATRRSFLIVVCGIPFERALVAHRLLGAWTILLVTGHGLYFVLDFVEHDELVEALFGHFILGLFGWLCVAVLGVCSFGWVRRHHFQIFVYSHYLFFGFFLFGMLHHKSFVPYAVVAGVIYAADLAFRYLSRSSPVPSLCSMDEAAGILSLRFPKRENVPYPMGSYVFLSVEGVDRLQWHPFSVASAEQDKEVEIHVKALGDYTQQLLALAKGAGGGKLAVSVEGPYGRLPHDLRRYRTVLLVGGGIGLTPLLGIARTLRGTACRVTLVWVVRTQPELDVFAPALDELRAAGNVAVVVHFTDKSAPLPAGAVKGRPDMGQVFSALPLGADESRVAVCACGPAPLTGAVWREVDARQSSKVAYDLEIEVFDF